MTMSFRVLLVCSVLGAMSGPLLAGEADWPEFRGPGGVGVSQAKGLPLSWSESENIAWKVKVPGTGWSSPVIGAGHIWLTSATDSGNSLHAICVDQSDGKLVRDVEVFPDNKPDKLHPLNSHASPTAILDEDRVYVHFGNYGTACLSTAGEILWKCQLDYKPYYGPSSTPVLWQDLLLVTCQGTDVRYTVALDKKTGQERWKKPHVGRNADSTPLLIHTPAGDQLVCNLAERVVAYDPRDGEIVWTVNQGNNYAQVPRPVYGHGMVYVCGGYFEPLLQAIRPTGSGDVTETHVVWTVKKAIPQNPSPVLVGDELYFVNDTGVATCLDALTGKQHWQERIGGNFYASPLFADGRIYLTSNDGTTTVIKPGQQLEKLAKNKIDERVMASLAVADQAIFLRSEGHLYRIELPRTKK